MNTTRRFWLYAVTLITLGILAVGVGDLLSIFFDFILKTNSLTGSATYNQQQLSLGVAMIVIGGPLWFFFWRAIQKRVKGNPEETGAGLRKLYLNFILVETSIMAAAAAAEVLRWLFSGTKSTGTPAASSLTLMIVGGLIWFYHWVISEREGQPSPAARTLRRWYMYILSGFGLVWISIGSVQLINTAFVNLPWWNTALVPGKFWDSTAQLSVAQIILGGCVWYLHWFRMAKKDLDSKLRQVYFYLLTIAGGAIAALVASIILLYRLIIWISGGVPAANNSHFQFLGWAIPTILMGLAIWGYHLRAAQEEAGRVQEKRQSAQRTYYYLMAFLGLGALAAGVSILIGIVIDTGSTGLTSGSGWWRTQLALGWAMTLVGLPMWMYYWNGILKRVQAAGNEEGRALSRRIFLYAVTGISIIILAADLVNILYQLLTGVIQHNAGANFLHNAKWSLQTLVVAALLLWYYWLTLRADQRRGPEAVVLHHNVTLLADDPGGELAARLENKLGYKIRVLYPVGPSGENISTHIEQEIDKVTDEIQSSPTDKVMLVISNGKIKVVPYQDKQ